MYILEVFKFHCVVLFKTHLALLCESSAKWFARESSCLRAYLFKLIRG